MGFVKIWVHLVWTTKKREPILTREIRREIFKHIRENAERKGIYIDFINGHLEHVHCLISLGSGQSIDKIMMLLKGESSHWINQSDIFLLGDLLKNKKVIHYRQLRYLAEKHESDILKLRFILNPFSFVFLLSGQEQFHLVMETLDTREATYIWHIEKDKQELRNQLQVIDRQLNMIRNDGRQAFLESQPVNFSRILHDYSDEQKGFILWKDLLEERIL